MGLFGDFIAERGIFENRIITYCQFYIDFTDYYSVQNTLGVSSKRINCKNCYFSALQLEITLYIDSMRILLKIPLKIEPFLNLF